MQSHKLFCTVKAPVALGKHSLSVSCSLLYRDVTKIAPQLHNMAKNSLQVSSFLRGSGDSSGKALLLPFGAGRTGQTEGELQ